VILSPLILLFTEMVRCEIRGSHDLDCEDCPILVCEPLSLVEIYHCSFLCDGSIISHSDVQLPQTVSRRVPGDGTQHFMKQERRCLCGSFIVRTYVGRILTEGVI
jgi:hypothetical protein